MHHLNIPLPLARRSLCAIVVAITAMVSTWARADEYSDALGLSKAGKFSEAIAKADQYLTTKPRDAQMQFIKGSILQKSGRETEALAVFTKLIEDYPELPEPYNNLAVIYAAQNQYEKARIALEMAIRNRPDYATAYENLGDVYAKLAYQAYAKSMQLDPSADNVDQKLARVNEVFGAKAGGTRKVTK